jgi:hypothetical protein
MNLPSVEVNSSMPRAWEAKCSGDPAFRWETIKGFSRVPEQIHGTSAQFRVPDEGDLPPDRRTVIDFPLVSCTDMHNVNDR